MLEKLDVKLGKTLSPVNYSWVNVRCHPEVLEWFGLTEFNVPTIVFYKPNSGKSAQLIGQFNEATVQEHVQRFMKGLLKSQPLLISQDKMKLSLECATISSTEADDDADFDDILAEILAEEEARKAQDA